MQKVLFVIKKSIQFFLIYMISAIIGEGVIIGILTAMGYDPLHGVMPDGTFAQLMPYYGFTLFILITILFWKLIEKRSIKELGFTKSVSGYLAGALFAIVILGVIVAGVCCTNGMSFNTVSHDINYQECILWFVAFLIQGSAEEVICRGFMLQSLRRKVSLPVAITVSSIAFVVPHILSLEGEISYVILSIISLFVVSGIFSMLVIRNNNLWIACGLHSIWNFVLSYVMGLRLSGSEGSGNGIIIFKVGKPSIINGGTYGIEGSVVTSIVLVIVLVVLIAEYKGQVKRHGI